jgi:hypothetical protein
MKPTLHIRLIHGLRCHSCGRVGYVDRLQLVCCACLGIQLARQERALEEQRSRMARIFGRVMAKARECGLIRGEAA